MNAQAILNERVKVELEVRPKLLIADTNCYIDHLATLRRLIQEKHYTLVAPLVGKLGHVLRIYVSRRLAPVAGGSSSPIPHSARLLTVRCRGAAI